jgi:hypothetical protein
MVDLRAGRALASAGPVDEVTAGLRQLEQARSRRPGRNRWPVPPPGSQAFGHLDRVWHRAVHVGFLGWPRERGVIRNEADQATGADGPADRLAHLVEDELLDGIVGQPVAPKGRAQSRAERRLRSAEPRFGRERRQYRDQCPVKSRARAFPQAKQFTDVRADRVANRTGGPGRRIRLVAAGRRVGKLSGQGRPPRAHLVERDLAQERGCCRGGRVNGALVPQNGFTGLRPCPPDFRLIARGQAEDDLARLVGGPQMTLVNGADR